MFSSPVWGVAYSLVLRSTVFNLGTWILWLNSNHMNLVQFRKTCTHKRHKLNSLKLMKRSLQRQTVAERRPKLSCMRDTPSVLGHTGAVIAVCIRCHRVTLTKYILYRLNVTGSLRFASNLACSIHLRIHWRHCTTLFVWDYLWTCFVLNQIVVWYKCNVGPSTVRKYW